MSARKDPAHVCGNSVEAETQNEDMKVCVWGSCDEAEEQTESQMSTSSRRASKLLYRPTVWRLKGL